MTTLYRLVTVAEARDQLSLLDDEDDARIDSMIIDASQDIMGYVNMHLEDWTDTSGLPLVDSSGNPQRVGATGHMDTAGDFILDTDTNGDPINAGISIIPGAVRRAALVLIARMDDDREGKGEPFNDTVKGFLWNHHQAGKFMT